VYRLIWSDAENQEERNWAWARNQKIKTKKQALLSLGENFLDKNTIGIIYAAPCCCEIFKAPLVRQLI